jgi:predicted nucleic acid-binding protein
MITALDTNILVSLWNEDDSLNLAAKAALRAALGEGRLIIAAPVFSELLASPSKDEAFLDEFLAATGISVDWNLDEIIWRLAGRAFQAHAARRRRQRELGPRRIVADFLIGAHAFQNGFSLLTLDVQFFRATFPRLSLAKI